MQALGAVCLVMTYVYLDESGDLGWSFDKPYRHGGSSRHLTIAALIVPDGLRHHPKRIIKDIYKVTKTSSSCELKGSSLSPQQKILFANKACALINKQPLIKITTITVYKPNVLEHIRKDQNIIYNYMASFLLLDNIKDFPEIEFVPDERTIKVKCGNSLVDYLQTKLWFELNSITVIRNKPQQSHNSLNIQFADFVSNIIWGNYEHSNSSAYNILNSVVIQKKLFFPKS